MDIKVGKPSDMSEKISVGIEFNSSITDCLKTKTLPDDSTYNHSNNNSKDNSKLKVQSSSSSSNLNSETKLGRKCLNSNKSLSFSIERMLNIHPQNKTKLSESNKNISERSCTVPLNSNLNSTELSQAKDTIFRDAEDDDINVDDDLDEEETAYFSGERLSVFDNNARGGGFQPGFNPGTVLPIGLPSRPIWPPLISYLGQQWSECNRDRFGVIRRVGHPYQNRTPPKRKKPRTAFTRQQVMELEKRFSRQKYLASAERSTLAKGLNMSDSQVKTWFQNRRTKWRRQTAEEREMERQAAQKFLLSIQREESQPLYSPLCATPSSGHFHPSLARGMDMRFLEQN